MRYQSYTSAIELTRSGSAGRGRVRTGRVYAKKLVIAAVSSENAQRSTTLPSRMW